MKKFFRAAAVAVAFSFLSASAIAADSAGDTQISQICIPMGEDIFFCFILPF